MSGCAGCKMSTKPNFPCTGKTCIGRCKGACPNGYNCQRNNYGIYRCVPNKQEVWELWWFWVLLILAVIIFILMVYLIYWKVRINRTVIKPAIAPVQSVPTAPVRPTFNGLPPYQQQF